MTLELQLTEANNGEHQRGLAPVSGLGVTVKFKTIVADPPWEYPEGFNSQPHAHDGPITHDKPLPYPSMTVEEICALQVSALADTDCRLWLWTTSRYLPDAFDVMKAWGFRYKTAAFVWVKSNKKSDTDFFGMGNWTRANAEICLLGIRGKPKRVSAAVRQVIRRPIMRHSEKPPEVRERIVTLMGDIPRVELFARVKTEGWSVWGNEVTSDVAMMPNS